jgi:hypothetical protein
LQRVGRAHPTRISQAIPVIAAGACSSNDALNLGWSQDKANIQCRVLERCERGGLNGAGVLSSCSSQLFATK